MKKDSIYFKKDIKGMVIKTKYLPYTKTKDSRAKAIHKRDNNTTYSKTIKLNSDIDEIDNSISRKKCKCNEYLRYLCFYN